MKASEIIESVRGLGGWGLDGGYIRRRCDEHGQTECPITAYAAHIANGSFYPSELALAAAHSVGIPRHVADAVIAAADDRSHAMLRARARSLIVWPREKAGSPREG